jgi:hypothetical protein
MAHGKRGMVDEPRDEPPADEQFNEHVKAYFLDLAAKGKDAWNAWRRDSANEDVRVTFAGIDFSKSPRDRIDFSGFEFGDKADFSGCRWRSREHPKGFLHGHARFSGAAFGNLSNFERAELGFHASFDGATFGFGASFGRAAFDNLATFSGAAFGEWAIFCDAAFGNDANFTGATFGKWANFAHAAFGLFASFEQTFFAGPVDFTGNVRREMDHEP